MKIDIAEILKNKPKGTVLYDALRDREVAYGFITKYKISCYTVREANISYSHCGTWPTAPDGLQILLPSKNMQDWEKFAWKKGDVLVTNINTYCIFEDWENDNYTKFKAKYICRGSDLHFYSDEVKPTYDWAKVKENDVVEFYIDTIERAKGGKLNLSTLEIEKFQFKDGDIVVREEDLGKCGAKCILIYKTACDSNKIKCYTFYNDYSKKVHLDSYIDNGELRLATDSEKQQLFDALAKEGKRWNAKTKVIEDLPKEHEFKPFDKVLVRDGKDTWTASLFINKDNSDYPYNTVGNCCWSQCIPYEGNEHLLGTTDSPKKGGENG